MIRKRLEERAGARRAGKMRTSYGQQVNPQEDLNSDKLINVGK